MPFYGSRMLIVLAVSEHTWALICASDSQETMMDHPLRTISYIADIGNIVVLMARRRMPRPDTQENVEASDPGQESRRQYKMICHVFESEDVSSGRDAFARVMSRK